MRTIVLRTTNECNLRCKYCYDNNNHGNTISKKIATDNFATNELQIIEDSKKIFGNNDKGTIIFHGGEPLLVDVDLLDDFCTRLRKDKNIRFSIQTNGTLINNKTITFFKKHNIHVGVSLDGSCPEQNSSRIFKNGYNSFNCVMNKIDLLKESGVGFGVVMSIGKLHIGSEKQLYDFLANNKIKCNIRPVFPTKNSNNNMVMTPKEYIIFFSNLFDIWFDDEEKRVTSYQINELAKVLSTAILPSYSDRLCECSPNCFNNFISLDVFGELYSCNRLYNINEFYYGNIRKMSMDEVYLKVEQLLKIRNKSIKESCGDCSLYNKCYGGCPAESFTAFGSIEEKSWNCEIKKGIYEHVKRKAYSNG